MDTTTVSYSGLTKTTTNPKNQTRTETRNALGSTKSVTDAGTKTVTYLYDPWGNLTRTTDPLLNQISIAYDRLGRKIQLTDPNLGTWTYSVDPLGQTWKQTDAKAQITTFTYDELQRMTRRLESDFDSRWDYDTATTGKGKLAEAYTWVGDASTGSKDYRRIYAYDSLSRISSVTTHLDWDYVTETSYDAYQRPYRQDHRRNSSAKGSGVGPATGFYSAYNAQGYASQIYRSNDGTNTLLEQIGAMDAEGHVTRESFGAASALQTGRGYNTYTGRIESIGSGPGSGGSVSPTLQNDSYAYDSIGNLSSRTQLVASSGAQLSEVFTYDNLNRLSTSLVGGQWTETTSYDAIGNVTSKTNVGTYTYSPSGAGSSRPNAVASITGNVGGVVNPGYSYDANGNTVSGLGRSYAWTSFNQPLRVDKLSSGSAVERTAFLYDTEHQRLRQTISPMSGGAPGAAANTIYYAGAIEKEIDTAAGTTTIRTYAPGRLGYVEEKISGTAVASTASGTRNARFFLSDHLGSALAVADESGAVLQRMNYDPWGRRRNTDGSDNSWTNLGTLVASQDHTGFTGQEQLDRLGLVNLNGRVYDPITGRMLSADPTIPDPQDAQAFNRYSYVLDDPLAFTDPSGFASDETDKQADATLPPVEVKGSGKADASKAPLRAAISVLGVLRQPSLAGATRIVAKYGMTAAGRVLAVAAVGALGEIVGPAVLVYAVASDEDVQQAALQGLQALASAVGLMAEAGAGADSDKKPAASDGGSRRPSKDVKDAADAAARDEHGKLHCQYCGQGLTEDPGHGNSREFDHYNPWSRGGGSGKDNIVDACRDCNRGPGGKGSKLFPDEWVPPPR